MAARRIHLAYYDHNDEFGRLLPRTGVITRRLTMYPGTWVVMKLDQSLDYGGRTFDELAIRSRWQGSEVGDPQEVSVFILLPRGGATVGEASRLEDFDHVAWGLARLV